ncbi:hypothetical protein GKZ90_0024115 [Flavobacterium sp. MC2016-06]|uniref:hypothetical protein n=1 Tax=Flavobacterium sp. MC2016-06 TaxID=2676308 RepID=UPI0012BAA6DA|nr:hypothetical protein [Flavobacterium sp. MC2016-06]MBU3861840.1 hypothetical protein [Flavobacterium sp. MC2016-06]
MKIITVPLFLLFNCNLFAQFAIITDSDGYVNVRNQAQKGNTISDKLENGFVVYCFEPKDNWLNIDYSKNNKELNGYIYKDRIKYLSEFTKIPLITETQTKVIFKKDSLNITVESKPFDSKTAKLTFVKGDKSILNKINGKRFWGTDGEIPKNCYKYIKVLIGNKTIEIPKNSIEDLFEPTLFNTKINYNKKDDVLYISCNNSDGAGGYEIVWIIEKGKYKERKIAYAF